MLLCVCVCAVSCVLGCTSKNVACPDNAEYCIVNTKMLKQKGVYYFIDAEGKEVGDSCSIHMQNLCCYDIGEDRIVLSGERKNNTMIFTRGTSEIKQDFFFLNEPKYTGLTAVKDRGDAILGLMNGGVTEKTYIDVLVLQTLDGEVLQRHDVEIYAEDILDDGSGAVIAGWYREPDKENHYCAEIIKYDLTILRIMSSINTERSIPSS